MARPAAADRRVAATDQEEKKTHFWRELQSDVRDYLLYFDHENIDDFSRFFKTVGGALRDSWKSIRDIPARIMDHPIIADRVGQGERDFWSDLGEQVGLMAGFAAAGGHAVSGALKLSSAVKERHWGRGLDGLVDIASGSSLALAVAGLAGARAIVAPLAATINMVRGGYNIVVGYKRHDQRKQIQGALDLTRSAGSFGRLLKSRSPIFRAVGVGFAPIAGAFQAGRGLHDVAIGLKNNDNRKELRGLVDIATAVGTALAFASGAAVIPGIALAVAANAVKLGYQFSPKIRKKVDAALDKIEPGLQTTVEKVSDLSQPLVAAFERFMSRFVKKVDPRAPRHYSKAQLAEITNLLLADGRYSREEASRLRTELEKVGQKSDLPKRDITTPPPLLRAKLVAELKTERERVDFVRFLLVVADYNFKIAPEERVFIESLAVSELGLSVEQFQRLIDERESESRLLQSESDTTAPAPTRGTAPTLAPAPTRGTAPTLAVG